MRDARLTPAAVALDARQQRTVPRLARTWEGSRAEELYNYPTPAAPVSRVAAIEHARCSRAETSCRRDREEEPAVRTTIQEDDTTAKTAAGPWAKPIERIAGSSTWAWWPDGSRTDDRRLGAAAVCLNGDDVHSYVSTGQMEVFDAEHWAIEVALRRSNASAEALQAHGVMTVSVFRDPLAAIRPIAHLDPGPGQHLTAVITEHARALSPHSIEAKIHWVTGQLGIAGSDEADCHANTAREDRGYTVRDRRYNSAINSARRISENRTAAKGKWEADKRSKHYA